MAGAVILLSGWAAWSTGAGFGSLAYACLPERFRQYVAIPHQTLFGALGLLLVVNHIRAHLYNRRMKSQGHLDISSFPLEMYTQNLAVVGYGLALTLAHVLFQRWIHGSSAASDLALLDPTIEATNNLGGTSKGRCSVFAAIISILPLPISGPVVFLYIFLISL